MLEISKLFFLLFTICSYTKATSVNETNKVFGLKSCIKKHPINCPYIKKDQIVPQTEECCQNLVEVFKCSWFSGDSFLTRYLQTLNSWNCSEQLELECAQKPYAVNDFTKNIYLLFCNKTQLEEKCSSILQDYMSQENTTSDIFRFLDSEKLASTITTDPCIQVAIYETNSSEFVEIINTFLVANPIVWCGFNVETVKENGISTWTCFSQRYKITTAIIASAHILLAVITVYISSMVIAVNLYTPSLRHSQSTYKVSIAISDVIIGLFVLPSVANNFLNRHKKPLKFETVSLENNRLPILSSNELTDKIYLTFFGMCFVISVFVSIFNLLFAAFDRFFAIFRPLSYRSYNNLKIAFRTTIFIWIIAFMISLLPIFLSPDLNYGLLFDLVGTLGGNSAIFVYLIISLPVPLMWVTILATYIKTHQQLKKSRKICSTKIKKSESKLVKTLLLMVLSFTLSFMPLLVVIVFGASLPNIDYRNPNNFDMRAACDLLSAEFFAYIVIIMNTFPNYFIYSWRNQQFRKAKFELTSKLFRKLTCLSFRKRVFSHSEENSSSKQSGKTGKTSLSGNTSSHQQTHF